MPDHLSFDERLSACLLGGAVGDAIGLPMEGLKRARARRIFRGPLRHRFLFGRGMISDDTEHACATAVALAKSNGDADRFIRELGNGLRAWLLTVPAGIGLATLRSGGRLLVGVSPRRSGVASAGNGACMRAAIIGVYWATDADKLRAFVDLSSRATHSDPRAVEGAWLIAREAAGLGVAEADSIWRFDLIDEMLKRDASPQEFADAFGLERGVSGYVLHTVPVAIYCSRWADGDFRRAITAASELGGDSDTLCAIVGGIVGAQAGVAGIPADWVRGLCEWPRTVRWMRQAGWAMAQGERPPKTFWPAYVLRSPLFIGTVLVHGLRRLLPPY